MFYNNMPDDIAISIENVSKSYRKWDSPASRLFIPAWEALRAFIQPDHSQSSKDPYKENKYCNDFWALRDISFEVKKGETVGIVGRNGSGKSTLLQIIAGTLQPTTGYVKINGRVAALLELGSGFNPEFTGRENVYLNASVLGLSRREIDARFDTIAEFADIGNFIDEPVKTYSSGMVLRLAFSVQTQVDPSIIIVDEALSVGDALFQKRCFQQLEKMQKSGTTLLLVSHEQEIVRTLTSRALFLKEGRIAAIGSSSEVILEYRRFLHDEERRYFQSITNHLIAKSSKKIDNEPSDKNVNIKSEFGDLDAFIIKTEVLDSEGSAKGVFYTGDHLKIRVACRVARQLTHLNVNIRIRSKEGIKVYSWGTLQQDMTIRARQLSCPIFWDQSFPAGSTFSVIFDCECHLGANFYEVQTSVCEERDPYQLDQRMLHWQDEAAFFQVIIRPREYTFGGLTDMQMSAVWNCPSS
jgi:lipopolysaccharide transport system ATP-binding protein